MNKKTLRRLSVLLCLALVLAMMPVAALAADTQFIYFNAGGGDLWDQGGAWFAAWVWGDGVEGQWATATYSEGEGIYFFEVPAAATSIKFLRMASGATEPSWTQGDTGYWNQTDDLTIDGDYYTITGWGGKDGKWSIFGDVTPEETTEVTEPVATFDYYLTGVANWTPNDAAYGMSQVSEGVYQIVVTLAAKEYEYKVTNGTWDKAWPQDGNYKLNVTSACDVTFTLDVNADTVTATGDGVGEIEEMVIDTVYAVGAGSGNFLNDAQWDPANSENAMTEENGVYTITYTGVAAGTYEYKFAANGGWTINWSYGDVTESGTTYDAWFNNSNNSKVVVANDNSTVTLTLDLSAVNLIDGSGAKCSVTIVAPETPVEPEPVVYDYYVAGAAGLCGNSWTPGDVTNQMTKNEDGLYVKEFVSVYGGTYEYKITTGSDWTNDPSYGYGEGNYTVTVTSLSKVTITFNAETKEANAVVEPIAYAPAVKYQVTQGATAESDFVNVRFLTSVDSLDYQSVKFTFVIGDQTNEQVCTTVYESLLADGVTINDASAVFGEGAKYFVAFTMTEVSDYETPIEVTVTWTDLDGKETTATRTIVIADALA